MKDRTHHARHDLIVVKLAFIGMAAVSAVAAAARADDHALRVSDNGRYLVRADGSPFFYLGDTAWELFHRLDREEADAYLRDRAAKGFTVIQAVVLAELDGLNTPNPYGHTPLIDNDPARPDERYFEHVDDIVRRAERLGLVIGMLPTWGDKWNRKWGVGPEVFTPEGARAYGRFLGARYKDAPIIWILGGDRNPEGERHLAITRAMAAGLEEGDGGAHLMTFHPQGGSSSSRWFHEDPWLDFNLFQSGHARFDLPNYEMTLADYRRTPTRPVLDGEPRYEDHPVDWNPHKGWFDAFDVRQAAYWSMLSGACGHTYGNHNIWQMWEPGRQPISSARTPWPQALKQVGSTHMLHLRRLFESRPFWKLVPDPSIVTGDAYEGAAHIRAARAEDGAFLLAYTPLGRPIEVDLDKLSGAAIVAWWFDPRTGEAKRIGRFDKAGARAFTPESSGRGNDWILVLDDAERRLPPPGAFQLDTPTTEP